MTERTTADTLGQEIQRLRLEANITLRKLAELVDVSPAYVSDIEHDRRRPSAEVLKRIANQLKQVGATYERLDTLNSRLDPDLQKWVSLTPAVRQMLREVKNSGRDPLDVVRQLQGTIPKKKGRDG